MIPFFKIVPSLVRVWMVVAYRPASFPSSLLAKGMVSLECLVVEASSPALWEQWDAVSLRALVVMQEQDFWSAAWAEVLPRSPEEQKFLECL